MYFPIISILTLIAAVAAVPATLPEIPASITIGDLTNRCDFGLSVSCCAADALDKPTQGGCFPLTEPALKPFRFVEICNGIPACCSSSMFDPDSFTISSEACEEITLTAEDINPE
ncbi:hypothetical protein TWF281_002890 [Arthrobotrys megalospora]